MTHGHHHLHLATSMWTVLWVAATVALELVLNWLLFGRGAERED